MNDCLRDRPPTSVFDARAREMVVAWHDDPCAGEEALIRLVAALCAAVAAEATVAERHRIHTRLRGPTRAFVPRDEYEETPPATPPPRLLPTWPPGTVVTPFDESGPTLTSASISVRDPEPDCA